MVIIWFVLLQTRDLQIIMRYLEHWAHRLFPKMPFDEVLERIEKLGTKNEVKVRLSTPINILFTPAEMQIVYTTIWISMSDRYYEEILLAWLWQNAFTRMWLLRSLSHVPYVPLIEFHFSFMQTCIKRMRLDMPILNDEFVGDDEEREEGIPGSEVSTCSFNFRNLFLQWVCWS